MGPAKTLDGWIDAHHPLLRNAGAGFGTDVGYGEDCLPLLLAKGQVPPSLSSPTEVIYGQSVGAFRALFGLSKGSELQVSHGKVPEEAVCTYIYLPVCLLSNVSLFLY